MHDPIGDLISGYLSDPAVGWSIGVYGAIAEFHRTTEEPGARADDPATVVTERGAIRVTGDPAVSVRAYEWPSRNRKRWVQGVLFCVPGEPGVVGARGAIAELGPDREAIRTEDRGAVLFDLGVAMPYVRACVRGTDPGLVEVLRRACGRSALDRTTGVMAAILEAQPHRVFLSPVARLEVYQPIPDGRGAEVTPEGPHTHLLPDLLAEGRSHGVPEVVPAGMVPCLEAHPPNPLMDATGRERPFDATLFSAFQVVMQAWGDPVFLAEKAALEQAVSRGNGPDRLPSAPGEIAAAARVVALRQVAQRHGETDLVATWRAALDPPEAQAGP